MQIAWFLRGTFDLLKSIYINSRLQVVKSWKWLKFEEKT